MWKPAELTAWFVPSGPNLGDSIFWKKRRNPYAVAPALISLPEKKVVGG
jgi:hypothetical protein